MLTACMIDGFGWFREADYRRSWLFFDEVEYILPRETTRPLVYPPRVFDSREYAVVHSDFDPELLELVIRQAAADAEQPELRKFAADQIPRKDLEYARLVVRHDREHAGLIPEHLVGDLVFPTMFLLDKLLLMSLLRGSIPIIGRSHANGLLQRKLAVSGLSKRSDKGRYHAVAAGLSLNFVPDERLEKIDFAELVRFKQEHQSLLARHQKHLLKVSKSFRTLNEGEAIDAQLAAMRLELEQEREMLETDARIAWKTMKADVTRHAVVAGATTFLSGLAILPGASTLADLLTAGLPAILASASSAAASSAESITKIRRAKKHGLAYLFEARRIGD